MIRIILERHFLYLWFAQITALVGQYVVNFALVIQVYDLTSETRFASSSIALLLLFTGLPALLLGPLAGVVADTMERRKVLLFTNIFRIILVLFYIPFHDSFIAILLVTAVLSSFTQFFIPAEAAMLPSVTSKRSRTLANGLFTTSLFATVLVGYLIATPLLNLYGSHSPYIVGAGLYLFSMVFLALLPKSQPIQAAIITASTNMYYHFYDNFKLIRRRISVMIPIAQLFLVQTVTAVFLALGPALSSQLFNASLRETGLYFILPITIGIIIGIIVAANIPELVRKSVVVASLILSAGAFGLLGLIANADSGTIYNTVIVAMVLLGFASALIGALSQTVLQENTHDAQRGKVYSVLNIALNVASTLPAIFLGVLADVFAPTTVMILMMVGLLLYAASFFRLLWRVY